MEITLEKLEDWDCNYSYDGFTVYVENHRILTIHTFSNFTAIKWLKEVQKTHNNKHGTLVVGVCVDRRYLHFEKNGLKDSPYDLLQLCVGSHCLINHLPEPDYFQIPKAFQNFFADPRVIAVGMDMFNVAKKLDRDYQIKIRNPIDLNCMAVKGLRRDDLDLGRYDLDRLATTVLGKHVDVIRPENKVEWYDRRFFRYDRVLTLEKVKYATVDPYLCFLIGSELLDVIGPERLHLIDASASEEKKKKKKKKTKKKKKKTS